MKDYDKKTDLTLLRKGLALVPDGVDRTYIGSLEGGDLGIEPGLLSRNRIAAHFAKESVGLFDRSLTLVEIDFESMDLGAKIVDVRGVSLGLPPVALTDCVEIRRILMDMDKAITEQITRIAEVVLTNPDKAAIDKVFTTLSSLVFHGDRNNVTVRKNIDAASMCISDVYAKQTRLVVQVNNFLKENCAGLAFITTFTDDDTSLVSLA